jgi:hypothetical protein
VIINAHKFLQKSLVGFLFILIIASFFRLFLLDLIEFKADEALSTWAVSQFYLSPSLPQIGIMASTGMNNFPLFHDLLIILAVFSRYPPVLSFLIALLNVILLGFFYLMVRRYYGNLVAFLSSSLMALSTWNILFSRKIWAQDLINLLLFPAIYFLLKLVVDQKKSASFGLFLCVSLLIQLHGSGAFFLAALVLILFVLKVQVNLKKAFLGFLVGLILAIPFFIYQLSTNCLDCLAILSYQAQKRPFDFSNFLRPFEYLGNQFVYSEFGRSYLEFYQNNPFVAVFQGLGTLIGSLLLIEILFFIVSFLIRDLKKYFDIKLKLAGLFILIVPSLYFLTKTAGFMMYYLIIAPFIYLFFCQMVVSLFKLKPTKFLGMSLISLLIVFIAANFYLNLLLFKFISQKKVIVGVYGPVFSVTQAKTEEVLKEYLFFKDQEQLKSYTYIFINSPFIHQKLGEYFLQKGALNFAEMEFNKQLLQTPDDLNSQANLALIYINLKRGEEAKTQIERLSQKDATVSAQLKKFLEESGYSNSN